MENNEKLIMNNKNVRNGILDTPNFRENYQEKFTFQKGITLVAIIITIIILLMLAGISISLLTGDNAIVGKAYEAKTAYNSASQNEADTINGLLNITDEVDTSSGIQQINDREGGTIPVPGGFSYLIGTKSTGFVIKNDNDNNEFVWIPCDLESNNPGDGTIIYKTYDWLVDNEYHLPPTAFNEYYTSDETDNANIISEIDTSIGTYKGFYISRYEAGTQTKRTSSGNLQKPISRPTGTPVVYGYNYIDWTDAVAQADGLYSKIHDNIESRLINGRGWDTTLKFIEQANSVPNYSLNGTGTGWYYGISGNDYHETGKPVGASTNMIKNIYDMGGNMYEWTAD